MPPEQVSALAQPPPVGVAPEEDETEDDEAPEQAARHASVKRTRAWKGRRGERCMPRQWRKAPPGLRVSRREVGERPA
jgi:hypothetical protein